MCAFITNDKIKHWAKLFALAEPEIQEMFYIWLSTYLEEKPTSPVSCSFQSMFKHLGTSRTAVLWEDKIIARDKELHKDTMAP